MKSPRELAAALAPLQDAVGLKNYREWALDPRTAQFLTLAADLLQPAPLTSDQLSQSHTVLNALVRRELIESFIDCVFRLDQIDLAGGGGMPEPDYGTDEELARTRDEIRRLIQRTAEREQTQEPAPAPASTPKRRKKQTNE